jgi:bifunctional UDP-N-acetylglucosamine pyrophosphorylase/glucosamine-1-phosphate N-acetyltransferase
VGDIRATAVVLAAGGGTRMKSSVPKVLHRVAGRPLLAYVLHALRPLPLDRQVIVASARRAEIEAAMRAEGFDRGITYVVQDPPRGTADAVKVALDEVGSIRGTLLVVQGATPLLETNTLDALLHVHSEHRPALTMLTARVPDPTGYGRVIKAAGEVQRVVEERDASYEERAVDEINAGVYAFDAAVLAEVLHEIDRTNAQEEYYLPDVIRLLRSAGREVRAYRTHPEEVLGVKSRRQLAKASQLLRQRACERWMDEGVTVVDPSATYIDASVTIGRDAIIHPFTFLEGVTTVGEGAEVGPQVRALDSEIGAAAKVSFSVVLSAVVGPDASVGPFASLRPGTRLDRGAKVGTFVEAKNSLIGEDSKVPHLSYMGDATLGRGVNVGAGTITCNWDGKEKHPTAIDDDAYLGSDTMLVAPVRVGARAATGAGSVVTRDVPPGALARGVPARIFEGRGDRMGAGGKVAATDGADGRGTD